MRPRPRSVFVPYELRGKLIWSKCDDLPRFTEPKQIIDYLQRNPNLSSRLLDWREEFSKEFIDEYVNYLGELIPGVRH